MTQVTLEDAGACLSHLIEEARDGEEIVITRDSAPVAKIVPLDDNAPRSQFGNAKDVLIFMADDFDAPLEEFDTGSLSPGPSPKREGEPGTVSERVAQRR